MKWFEFDGDAENYYLRKNFKSLRVKAGLKQEDVANRLGLYRTTFVKYENNPKSIPIRLLLKLRFIYNCDYNAFFNDV